MKKKNLVHGIDTTPRQRWVFFPLAVGIFNKTKFSNFCFCFLFFHFLVFIIICWLNLVKKQEKGRKGNHNFLLTHPYVLQPIRFHAWSLFIFFFSPFLSLPNSLKIISLLLLSQFYLFYFGKLEFWFLMFVLYVQIIFNVSNMSV